MIKLPQRIDLARETTVAGLASRLTTFQDDVLEYLRGLPTFEHVTFETDATGDDYVPTQIEVPSGVMWAGGYDARGAALPTATVAWQPSEDPKQPGIRVTITGPTPGEQSTVTLLVLGNG